MSKSLSFATIVLLLVAQSAFSEIQQLDLSGEVVVVDPEITAIEVGDRFSFTITFDDSDIDTNASLTNGRFLELITGLAAQAHPDNDGSWVPTGTFDQSATNTVTNSSGNNFAWQIRGNGYPDGGPGWTFQDFDLSFQ
ncbi:MAG: hypothetical protein AAF446_06195 [Pseudomonadota bacterium]